MCGRPDDATYVEYMFLIFKLDESGKCVDAFGRRTRAALSTRARASKRLPQLCGNVYKSNMVNSANHANPFRRELELCEMTNDRNALRAANTD